MFDNDWSKPDAVNEDGCKFWLDKSTTEYARKPDSFGTKLEDWSAMLVQEPNGRRTRILVNERHEIRAEDQMLAGIFSKIAVFKMLKRDE